MSKRPKIDVFNTIVILTTAALLIWALIVLGKSPAAWVFPSAHAGTADLTWTAPTQYCSGAPLTDLTGYSMTYGQAREALPLTPMSKTVTGLKPGVWWFSLAAVNSVGARSEFVTVEKTVLPEEFKTVGGPAYTFIKAEGNILVLPVGTVAAGVQCDAAQSVNGKYVIPRSAVTWSASARPVVVVADCG